MQLKTILTRLLEAGIPFRTLMLEGGFTIVVTQRGGRIFGPFAAPEKDGLFWVSPVFSNADSFSRFLASGAWNLGGDRIWIAPEIQFSIADRQRFWETLQTPVAVDPGNWTLAAQEAGECEVSLEQTLSLEAKVIAQGEVSLCLKRKIQPAANPLRCLPGSDQLLDGVQYTGYEQLLHLSGDGAASAECWDLLQVQPNGQVYIPMYVPHPGVNYYEPVADLEHLTPGGVWLSATGDRRYKVGYRAACVTGRLGYATRWNEQCCLLVRNFFNSPSASYREEPPLAPGVNGFSVHVYNDDGASGGFAELECNLPGVAGDTGYHSSMDRVSTWIYIGPHQKLQSIASTLLGAGFPDYWEKEKSHV